MVLQNFILSPLSLKPRHKTKLNDVRSFHMRMTVIFGGLDRNPSIMDGGSPGADVRHRTISSAWVRSLKDQSLKIGLVR